jgi:hypothetical protein
MFNSCGVFELLSRKGSKKYRLEGTVQGAAEKEQCSAGGLYERRGSVGGAEMQVSMRKL